MFLGPQHCTGHRACPISPCLPLPAPPACLNHPTHTRLFWPQSGRQAPTLSYWCFSPGLSMKQITEMRVGSHSISIVFAHTMHSLRLCSTRCCGWAFLLPVGASAALQQLGTKKTQAQGAAQAAAGGQSHVPDKSSGRLSCPARCAPSCLPAARSPLLTRLPTSWGWPSLCAWRMATSSTRNR